jgi:Leucine-rich repeat (LRR) protein
MIIWQKFAILLFSVLLVCTAAKVKSKDDTSNSDELLEFSHEEDKSTDYSEEHDINEILSEEKEDKKDKELYTFPVCRVSKADLCVCDKTQKRIDCRKQTRDLNGGKAEVIPLQSASISMGSDFTPKYVYLTGNKIRYLEQDSLLPGMRATVEGIDLGFNQIDFIDEGAFDKFDNLRKLRLNHNWLKINQSMDGWITKELGNKLEVLNLAYNSIKFLNDGAFDSLHKLKKLILDGNVGLQLTAKTFKKDGLEVLETLSLDNCGIKNLDPNVFTNLPELNYISLINNPISALPASLKLVPNLRTLDLSETNIDKLGKNIFKGYDNLVNLYLRAMSKIEKYDDCDFCELTKLESLDLSGSKKLATIHNNAFGFKRDQAKALKYIKSVKMINCSLSTFDRDMLPWDKLEGLAIGGNPLNCDKKLEWLIQDRVLHLFPGDMPICAAPPDLKGKHLQTVMKDAQSHSGIGSMFKTIFYAGLAVGLVGSILTGVLYMNKRYDGNLVSTLFSGRRPDGTGFRDLNADVGRENGQRVFEDDDNEFEPRPAAV